MKGGKDEVDGKIEQLKRILIKANEDLNSEENKEYLERKRKAFTMKAEHQTYIIYDFESDVTKPCRCRHFNSWRFSRLQRLQTQHFHL